MKKVLIDTNIVIDYLGKREPFYEESMQIIIAGAFDDVDVWVPAQSTIDAFYVLNKKADSTVLQNSMGRLFKYFNLVSLAPEDCIKAVQLQWSDYENCLIALAAAKANVDYIVTRDKTGFERSLIPALSPEEFLEIFHAEHNLDYAEASINNAATNID